ncbi:hypothetical protein VNO78_18574 [Psophocarpus tetragonolobus]|uniref:Uncharacterized protein n=1 Tax=Psophocarpus tetragonolobus TaxID=3891 RepID=A0AAN9SPT6_PSOTE
MCTVLLVSPRPTTRLDLFSSQRTENLQTGFCSLSSACVKISSHLPTTLPPTICCTFSNLGVVEKVMHYSVSYCCFASHPLPDAGLYLQFLIQGCSI